MDKNTEIILSALIKRDIKQLLKNKTFRDIMFRLYEQDIDKIISRKKELEREELTTVCNMKGN